MFDMERKIQAVIFDMYETLVTQLQSPLYYGTQIAQDLGLAPEAFLPEWRNTEEDRATGKQTFEEVMEMLTLFQLITGCNLCGTFPVKIPSNENVAISLRKFF